MGLIGKIFKKKSTNAPTSPAAPQTKAEAQRRVAPRVKLSALHNLSFEWEEPLPVRTVRLANISTSGIGFLRSSGGNASWPPQGGKFKGSLLCDGEKLPLQGEVVHLSPQVVGCQYEGDVVRLNAALQRYFQIEIAAISMKEAPQNMLQAEADGSPHWMHGRNNSEIHLVEKDGKILRFTLSFLANYLECDEQGKCRAGQVVDGRTRGSVSYAESAVIHWVKGLPEDLALNAVKFIEQAQALNPELRRQMITAIESARK